MRRVVAFLLTFLAFGMGASSLSRAAVRPFHDLSVTERVDLQQSEHRLLTFDLTLQALEQALRQKKISRREYAYEYRDITAFIAEEAEYQNDILTKDSGFDEDAREVMQNVAKYAVLVPAYILSIVFGGSPGSLTPQ